MSDTNYKPDGTGVVMGDTKPMPDKGTGTGMTGHATHDEGMSQDQSATNSMGKISGTDSDPMDRCYSPDPTFGKAAGDKAAY